MPSHMIGATSGRASTLAGRPASETVPKWWAISGAVATVAATVTAMPSASGRGQRARAGGAAAGASVRIPATAANESCQPGSPHARGFTPSVTQAASSSAYQREAGRAAASATSDAAPITPARCSDGPAPASGT